MTGTVLAGHGSVAELPNCMEPLSLALRWAWIPTSGPPTAVNGSFPCLSLAEQVRQPARQRRSWAAAGGAQDRGLLHLWQHPGTQSTWQGSEYPGRTPYFLSSHLSLSRTLAFGFPVTHAGLWVAEDCSG